MSKAAAAQAALSSDTFLKSLIKQSAFGFGLEDALAIAESMLGKGDISAILFTLACVNQIKRNVLQAFDAVESVKRSYPKLSLEKPDRASDSLNMGACRLTGYIFLHMVPSHPLARKMLSKSGSPIYGVPSNLDTAGARINKEINMDLGIVAKPIIATEAQAKIIVGVLDSI